MGSTLRLITSKVTIAIAEDDALVREALTALLAKQPGLTVVATGADISAVNACQAEPDIILIDARQQDGSDLLTSAALVQAATRAKIIATGISTDYGYLVGLLQAGVSGFVLRDALFTELVSTIRAVAAGSKVLPPSLLTTLVSDLARTGGQHGAEPVSAFDRMTPQQRQIVLLIASGKSNKEIAAQKNISTNTAKTHVRNIMGKLSVHTRLQIAAQANQERWTLWNAPDEPEAALSAQR